MTVNAAATNRDGLNPFAWTYSCVLKEEGTWGHIRRLGRNLRSHRR